MVGKGDLKGPDKANQNPRELSKHGPFLFKFGHFQLFLSIKMFKTFCFGRRWFHGVANLKNRSDFSYTAPRGTFPGRQPRGTSVSRHGDKPKIKFICSKLTCSNRPMFELSFPLFISRDDLRIPSKPLLLLPRPLVK